MKRPGKILAASKESEVADETIVLPPKDRIVNLLRKYGNLSMFKISVLDKIAPRTIRGHLTELVGMRIIKRSTCPQCGSNTTYKLA